MTLKRFVFKTHKWLAVSVGFFTLVWFASGIIMVLPKNMRGPFQAQAAGNAGAPDFKGIAITVPQAIAAAETAAGGNIVTTNVELRGIEGRLYYQIAAAKSGVHLIDAVSGGRLEITEEYARQMAMRVMNGRGQTRESEVVRKHGIEYPWGPIPAFRFAFDDAAGTIVFVGANTAEVVSNHRMGRILTAVANTHTLGFLKPLLANRGTRVVLILFSFVGLVMTLFGSWILLIQFQNWRAKRAGRVVEA